MTKIVGQARAKQRGYYPLPSGPCRFVEEDEVFDLVEGLTKGKWFEVIEPQAEGKPAKGKPVSDLV